MIQPYSYVGVDPIIVTDDFKIVLALRGDNAGAEEGKWHIPGALVKADETLEQALKRAVKEKTHLDITLFTGDVGDSFVGMYDSINREPRYRDIALSFLCKITRGDMRPGPRMVDVRAFKTDELYELDISFDHKRIVLDAVDAIWQRGYLK